VKPETRSPKPEMRNNTRNWLQLYVDAMTERDPYKRVALVRELRQIPKHDESEEWMDKLFEDRPLSKGIRSAISARRPAKLKRSRKR
jgi:hypothetical protein